MTTYPLPSNVAQYIDAMGRPTPDYYRWLRQVDRFGTGNASGLPTGGTTGQVLEKASATDGDAIWHTLVKGDVGLGDVDNTSDASKPVSTATQTALNAKANTADLGTAAFAATTDFDVPRTPSALTRTNDTNVTLTLGGTPATALLQATSITVGWSGSLSVARGGTGVSTPSGTALDNITGFALTGILSRAGGGAYNAVTITAPAAGVTVSNGNGVSGNPTLALANDLAAVEGLSSTGIARRTGTDAWSVGALVTYAEIQNVSAQYKLLGRVSSGAGPVEEIDVGTWTTYTPTVVSTSGTITTASASGRYLKIGKLIVFQMAITITTNGTGAGVVNASLPFNAAANSVFAGRANSVSGKMLQCSSSTGSTNLFIRNYDNTYPGATGETLIVSGFYEST